MARLERRVSHESFAAASGATEITMIQLAEKLTEKQRHCRWLGDRDKLFISRQQLQPHDDLRRGRVSNWCCYFLPLRTDDTYSTERHHHVSARMRTDS